MTEAASLPDDVMPARMCLTCPHLGAAGAPEELFGDYPFDDGDRAHGCHEDPYWGTPKASVLCRGFYARARRHGYIENLPGSPA